MTDAPNKSGVVDSMSLMEGFISVELPGQRLNEIIATYYSVIRDGTNTR